MEKELKELIDIVTGKKEEDENTKKIFYTALFLLKQLNSSKK